MAVISFVNQKGGCGKSTLAVHFAWWLANQGHRVGVIDSDGQTSAYRWLTEMESGIEVSPIANGDELPDAIEEASSEFDHVVVDGGAMMSIVTLNILMSSDVSIIPIRPTALDLNSTGLALKNALRVQKARAGYPLTRLVINCAVKGTKLLSETQEALKGKGLLQTVISQRQSVADTFGQRQVIWTMPGQNTNSIRESVGEFESLCNEIKGVIEEIPFVTTLNEGELYATA